MSKTAEALEEKRLQSIAREYKKKGYQVLLHPSRSELPDFLSSFSLDMIAINDQENVVVEVKSKPTLTKSSYLTPLAKAVNNQPGWRFELVVTNPVKSAVVEGNAQILLTSEIKERIRLVRELSGKEQAAALILAWSAIEAALRLVGQEQGLELAKKPSLLIIKELYSLGVISQEDYQILDEGLQSRNLIVHGFRETKPTPTLVNDLIGTIEKLLNIGNANSPA
ncbi:hypothetical protein [Nostoc sp. 106C]|uniref:hypothetical protein n=1 Tax=Nostoc sp. 106C TaxID=1932667 RepID=UPI000A38E40F|nr:hypothetical protein [Nostoc sp. 106C]OUL35869.1 hypothetical protein BV375_01190 [Nostoc sp. 106C]